MANMYQLIFQKIIHSTTNADSFFALTHNEMNNQLNKGL